MSNKAIRTGAEYFLNRELSWLEFNHRVLEEALDPGTPLLERVKFFCITGSNLDEFFEVRVAVLAARPRPGPGPNWLPVSHLRLARSGRP
jgi:polyphosphate kinase